MKLKIRKATVNDLKIIKELNRKYLKETHRNWKEMLSSEKIVMIIAELNGKSVGFSGIELREWNNTAQITEIAVATKYRRKGIGRALIKKIKQIAKKWKVRTIIAEVGSLNPALQFYLKCGFRVCGFNDRYYTNNPGEFAFFLSYDLKA
jgi:ribosomal protein S18 acetylase RimI-like enzyme